MLIVRDYFVLKHICSATLTASDIPHISASRISLFLLRAVYTKDTRAAEYSIMLQSNFTDAVFLCIFSYFRENIKYQPVISVALALATG